MKKTTPPILAVAVLSLLAFGQSVSADILLTDNFLETAGNNQNVNQALNNGRLGGTLAPGFIVSGSAYTLGGDHHQMGNTGTEVGQSQGGPYNKDYVLIAFGGSFQSKVDVTGAALGGPLKISFDLYESSTFNAGGDPTNWASFTLRGAGGGNGFPVAGAGEFGMLRRTNGAIEVFQNGNASVTPGGTGPGGYDVAGFTDTEDFHWDWTFTNTAGTGSAFDGSGSVAHWENGPNSGDITLGQLSASGLFPGWSDAGNRFAGLDNLVIENAPVPEPASAALLTVGLGLLLARRRRAA